MLYFYGILEDNRHCDMTSTFVLYGNNQGPLWSSHITNGVTFSGKICYFESHFSVFLITVNMNEQYIHVLSIKST